MTPFLLAVGVILRAAAYLSNRSLWLDEASLANNILTRSFAGLFLKLDHEDTAPVGFLQLEKVVTSIFGGGERALRLIPFLAGLASLFLFARVARRCLPAPAVPIAVGLFSVCGPLIFYSSELKPYSLDVTIALALTDLAIQSRESGRSGQRALATLAVTGAVAVFFSHPAIFVLAGTGSALALSAFRRGQTARGRWLAATGLLWVVAFAALYVLFVRVQTHDAALVRYWTEEFMPLPPRSFADLRWFPGRVRALFAGPAGLEFAGIGILAALTGCARLLATDRTLLGILVGPGLFAMLASGLHAYPFSGRLLLFFVPSVILLVALGAHVAREATRSTAPVVGVGLIVLLFLHPTLYAAQALVHPRTREEIRPVLASVRAHRSPGERIFVHREAQCAFEYYSNRFGFAARDVTVGGPAKKWSDLRAQLDSLPEGRTWFVFSHATEIDGLEEERILVSDLDERAKRLAEYRAPGAAAYLYDLPAQGSSSSGAPPR